jgi:dipeptidase E
MRLYLSSFRLGNQPQRLVRLVGARRRAVVIVNSCDLFEDEPRRARVLQEIEALRSLDISAEELDLRRYFASREAGAELRQQLAECGLIWVRGGNPFVLRRALKASGLDLILRDLLERDAIVYGGYSAGPAMLTPSLHGVELIDDPIAVPPGYDPATVWECLGVLPYALAVHYQSPHPESAATDLSVRYFIEHHMLFKALRDGEAIVVDGADEQIVG